MLGLYSLNLMRIALEIARHNAVYQDIATKYFEHFLHIVEAMNNVGGEGIGLWDDQDKFNKSITVPDMKSILWLAQARPRSSSIRRRMPSRISNSSFRASATVASATSFFGATASNPAWDLCK